MKTQVQQNQNNINNILVIDDDEMLLYAIRKKLELANYKVTISANVHDAYFKLGVTKPDLIMLDVIMPDMNGVEFMNLINFNYMASKTPVILMSYLPKEQLMKMGYNIDCEYYLSKPFNVDALPTIIKKSKFAA